MQLDRASLKNMFLESPQLIGPVIIGCDFAKEFGLIINFNYESISYKRDGTVRKCKFSQRRIAEVNDNSSSTQDCLFNSSFPRTVTPDNQIPPVDKSEPLTAARGSLKGPHSNNEVGEAYVSISRWKQFQRDGNILASRSSK
jgi:hypothetical protein